MVPAAADDACFFPTGIAAVDFSFLFTATGDLADMATFSDNGTGGIPSRVDFRLRHT